MNRTCIVAAAALAACILGGGMSGAQASLRPHRTAAASSDAPSCAQERQNAQSEGRKPNCEPARAAND
ncbi:MAG: hypothetical protein JSR21_14910 [Proteobacteria bacterium]|nr:hypothetical protein [Pseudomonadota bacterium]